MNAKLKVWFVIRVGWNSANQPSSAARRKPKDDFESNRMKLVGIFEAETEEQAKAKFTGTVYNGQRLFATANSRSVKGLNAQVRRLWREKL